MRESESEIMPKKSAWYRNPVSIAALIVSFLSISSWIANTIIADAKQAAKIEKTEEKVAEIAKEVTEHDKEINNAETRQQIIQRDLEYVRESVKQILDEVKRKK